MKSLFRFFLCFVALSVNAASGLLFSVQTSGYPLASVVTFELCLNAKSKPVSCQRFTSNNMNLAIKTVIPNHTYPYAGIKVVDNPTYTFGTSSTSCTMNPANGYCLFAASNASSTTIPILYNNIPLQVLPLTLPNANVGQGYYAQFTTQNGVPPYKYTMTGTLPSGLTFNSSTAILIGTPTTSGPYNITLTVSDSATPTQTVSESYTIYVSNGLNFYPLSPLPDGTYGVNYSETILAQGGNGTYTYGTYTNPPNYTLPSGLGIVPSTGVLSGVLSAYGLYNFYVTATDTSTPQKSGAVLYSLLINGPLSISPTVLPDANVNQSFSVQFSTLGGSSPYTYSYTGVLPAGVSLSRTGLLSGTPLFAGNYNFTIQTKDTSGLLGYYNYNLSVAGLLDITPNELPSGTALLPYSETLSVYNGIPPYVCFVSSSNPLPNGLALNSNTCTISGTPTTPGSYSFSITAYDSTQASGVINYDLNIQGNVVITPTTLASAALTQPYSQQLLANGGISGYTFRKASGTLPYGITLSSSGLLSGTPTTVGIYSFKVTATDSMSPPNFGEQSYVLSVNGSITITTSSPLTPATIQTPYSTQLQSSGGTAPYKYTMGQGSLPKDLTLSTDGLISGTPKYVGTYGFSIQSTDNYGNIGSKVFTMDVGGSLYFSPPPPTGPRDFFTYSIPSSGTPPPFSQTITVNGTTQACTWKVISPNGLPTGCVLNTSPDGLSATIYCANGPTYMGQYTFTIQATTGIYSGVGTYVMAVSGPFVISPSSLPDGILNKPYGISTSTPNGPILSVSSDVSSATFQVTGTNQLPPGLTLTNQSDGKTALISGRPSKEGSFPFTITATYVNGLTYTATQNYTVNVGADIQLNYPNNTLFTATQNVAFSKTFVAKDGTAPYTYKLGSNNFPASANVSLNSSTGELTGTLSTTDTYSFQVSATDSANVVSPIYDYTITASTNATITPTTLQANQNVSYAQQLTLSSTSATCTSPTFSITQGQLPTELTMTSSGLIQGIPKVSGKSFITVNGGSSQCFASQVIAITVNPSTITLSPQSLPNVTSGAYYSQTISVSPSSQYCFKLINGTSMPAGFTLSPLCSSFQYASQGTISGSTQGNVNQTFTIEAIQQVSPTTTGTATYTLANYCTGTPVYMQSTEGCNSQTVSFPSGNCTIYYTANCNNKTPAGPCQCANDIAFPPKILCKSGTSCIIKP